MFEKCPLTKAELETAESRVKDKLRVWQKLSKFAILSIYDLNFGGKLLYAVNEAYYLHLVKI